MKALSFTLLTLSSVSCLAATYQVGSTRAFANPNALYLADVLMDGDTITIDAETYSGTAALAVWQNNNLLIKGIGGQPQLDAAGEAIWGKGIWVLAGNNITVENAEFFGASVPDKNGAGIRLDGIGLTVRHCYFHDNENGILTSNPPSGQWLHAHARLCLSTSHSCRSQNDFKHPDRRRSIRVRISYFSRSNSTNQSTALS